MDSLYDKHNTQTCEAEIGVDIFALGLVSEVTRGGHILEKLPTNRVWEARTRSDMAGRWRQFTPPNLTPPATLTERRYRGRYHGRYFVDDNS